MGAGVSTSSRASCGDRRSAVARQNVENGKEIEQKIRDIFGFGTPIHRNSSQPDILDKGIVGEVKSSLKGERVVLFTDQIERYIRMAEDRKMSAFYFIGLYEVGYDPKIYDLENKVLTDIYVLGIDRLESLLRLDPSHTKWKLIGKLKRKVENIEKGQAFLDGNKKNGLSIPNDRKYDKKKKDTICALLRSNKKGAYVRLGAKELDALCPHIEERCNSAPIMLHSARSGDCLTDSPPDPRTTLLGFQASE